MKVIHIQLLSKMAGAQVVAYRELLDLKQEIEYAFIMKCDGELGEAVRNEGVKVSFVPSLQRSINLLQDLRALKELIRVIKKEGGDIVHTHSSKTGILGRIASKVNKRKTIHTVHGFAFPSAKTKIEGGVYFYLEKLASYFTDKLVVLNSTDYDFAVTKLKYSKDKVVLLPNGVDTNLYLPGKQKTSDTSASLRVIMVGRLCEQKDPATLIRAMSTTNESISLDIVGDGELLSELRDLIAELKLQNRVTLLGWKSNLHELLAQYDVFVLPSLWEGLPLAILEAMSCGLPVIATNIPGNKDLVEDGVTGFLIEKKSPRSLSSALDVLNKDRDLLKEFGEQARYKACEKYQQYDRSSKMKEVYLDLAGSKSC